MAARLRIAGCQVVVGTCPDLGTIRPIQPPLRWLAPYLYRLIARNRHRLPGGTPACAIRPL